MLILEADTMTDGQPDSNRDNNEEGSEDNNRDELNDEEDGIDRATISEQSTSENEDVYKKEDELEQADSQQSSVNEEQINGDANDENSAKAIPTKNAIENEENKESVGFSVLLFRSFSKEVKEDGNTRQLYKTY